MRTENTKTNDVNIQHTTENKRKGGFSDKTGWDWLQLALQFLAALAIPIAIAVGTLWFSYQQNQTNLRIADDQQQETTLQTYFDQMSALLLDKNLRDSKPFDVVREVARARTLTALRRLDVIRKGALLKFLYESRLIGVENLLHGGELEHIQAIVSLSGADLSGVSLVGVSLLGIDLSNAHLAGADLTGASLHWAVLSNTDLTKVHLAGVDFGVADLSRSDLRGVDLRGADFYQADLTDANFYKAKVTDTQLEKARYTSGITLPNGSHNVPSG